MDDSLAQGEEMRQLLHTGGGGGGNGGCSAVLVIVIVIVIIIVVIIIITTIIIIIIINNNNYNNDDNDDDDNDNYVFICNGAFISFAFIQRFAFFFVAVVATTIIITVIVVIVVVVAVVIISFCFLFHYFFQCGASVVLFLLDAGPQAQPSLFGPGASRSLAAFKQSSRPRHKRHVRQVLVAVGADARHTRCTRCRLFARLALEQPRDSISRPLVDFDRSAKLVRLLQGCRLAVPHAYTFARPGVGAVGAS